jgi:hypothetical protein
VRGHLIARADLDPTRVVATVRGILLRRSDAERGRADAVSAAAREIEELIQAESRWSQST